MFKNGYKGNTSFKWYLTLQRRRLYRNRQRSFSTSTYYVFTTFIYTISKTQRIYTTNRYSEENAEKENYYKMKCHPLWQTHQSWEITEYMLGPDNIISKDILLYTLVSLSVWNIGKFNFIKLKCQKQVLLA